MTELKLKMLITPQTSHFGVRLSADKYEGKWLFNVTFNDLCACTYSVNKYLSGERETLSVQ